MNLEREYSSQSTNEDGASSCIVRIENKLNIRCDADVVGDWEIVEQFQVGLSCVANLV